MIYIVSVPHINAGQTGSYRYSDASIVDAIKVMNGDLGAFRCLLHPNGRAMLAELSGIEPVRCPGTADYTDGDRMLIARTKAFGSIDPEDYTFEWLEYTE